MISNRIADPRKAVFQGAETNRSAHIIVEADENFNGLDLHHATEDAKQLPNKKSEVDSNENITSRVDELQYTAAANCREGEAQNHSRQKATSGQVQNKTLSSMPLGREMHKGSPQKCASATKYSLRRSKQGPESSPTNRLASPAATCSPLSSTPIGSSRRTPLKSSGGMGATTNHSNMSGTSPSNSKLPRQQPLLGSTRKGPAIVQPVKTVSYMASGEVEQEYGSSGGNMQNMATRIQSSSRTSGVRISSGAVANAGRYGGSCPTANNKSIVFSIPNVGKSLTSETVWQLAPDLEQRVHATVTSHAIVMEMVEAAFAKIASGSGPRVVADLAKQAEVINATDATLEESGHEGGNPTTVFKNKLLLCCPVM